MKILMLTESNYPLDIRVKQEAVKLTENGYQVTVVALKEKDQEYFEIIDQVRIYRVPEIELFKQGKHLPTGKTSVLKRLNTIIKAIIGYGFEFTYFTLACYLYSLAIFFRHGFNVIHTHNPPDTLFIVALLWRPFGVKFVYDHHDLSPDLFMEKYGTRGKLIYKILLFLEKMSCKIADIVIATNESYKKIEIERCGIPAEKIFVVRNGPDLTKMKISEPVPDIRSKAGTILCYLGAINIQDGLDYLLATLHEIVFKFNYRDILLLVIGDGDYLPNIKELAEELGLTRYILFTGFISGRSELCGLLSTADVFVDAAPKSFLNDASTFIKHMEYMIFEKPVVSFALKESMFSLNGAGLFVQPNNTSELAGKILELIDNTNKRLELSAKAKERVKELAWDRVSQPLIQAYGRLQQS